MSKLTVRKALCFILALALVFAFAGCSKSDEGETTEPAAESEPDSATEPATVTTTAAPTTAAPTTQAETTTAAPAEGEAIQDIVNTLEAKHFYMAGTMNMTDGQSMDAKVTCDGDNYRLEITSKQMNMSIIYLDSVPYIVNNSSNTYAVIDDAALSSMDQVLGSLSQYGVKLSNADINEMKSMISNFDQNMDYSQYINDGEYSEYTATVDGEDYICSVYSTDYGKIRIYTQNGALKIIDVFDADGLRQMNLVVSAFIPEVLSPITLNGLTKAASVLNLFTS